MPGAAAEVGAEVLPHHGGAQVPSIGRHDAAVDPAGPPLDEPFQVWFMQTAVAPAS